MTRAITAVISIAAVALAASGCRSDAGVDRPYVERDSAGVRVVEHAASSGPAARWSIDVASGTEFGGPNADPPLYRVSGALRLADGRVAAADRGNARVVVFAPDGTLLSVSGRRGEGPGEFTNLALISRWRADSLIAWDSEQRRFTVLGPDGAFGRNFSLVLAEDVVFASTRAVFADGSFFATGFVDLPPTVETGLHRFSSPGYWFGADGVLRAELGPLQGSESYMEQFAGGISFWEPIFGRSTHHVAGPRLVIAANDTYELRYHRPSGELVQIVRWLRAAIPVGRAAVAGAIERMVESAATGREERTRQTASQMPVPETMPAYDRILYDTLGRTWVEEYDPTHGPSSEWVVFSPEGAQVASATMPRSFTPMDAGADHILGVLLDELEVEHLVGAAIATSPLD